MDTNTCKGGLLGTIIIDLYDHANATNDLDKSKWEKTNQGENHRLITKRSVVQLIMILGTTVYHDTI